MAQFSTIFPPIPKTMWRPGDSELAIVSSRDKLIVRGPHVTLDPGMFGVEFQLALRDGGGQVEPDCAVAMVQATAHGQFLAEGQVTAGQIGQPAVGMYGGARLNVIVEHRIENVEFRVDGLGVCPVRFHGIKLIPRPGQVWFPAEMTQTVDHWLHNPVDRSSTCVISTPLSTPPVALPPGEYRVGIKFMPPPGMTEGAIAEIDAASAQGELVPPQRITAESVLANFGIPDSKIRFRLDTVHTGVRLRIHTLIPGVTVQWARLATAEESVWQHYFNLGGLDSPLGPPASTFMLDEQALPYIIGWVRRFELGAIYWTVEHGPCEVLGALGVHFDMLGGTGSLLGFPVTRPQRVTSPAGSQGVIQQFRRGDQVGVLACRDRGQVIALVGEPAARYLAQGGPAGPLGFPTGDGHFEGGGFLSV